MSEILKWGSYAEAWHEHISLNVSSEKQRLSGNGDFFFFFCTSIYLDPELIYLIGMEWSKLVALMQTVQNLTVWEQVGYDPMLHNSSCALDALSGKKLW